METLDSLLKRLEKEPDNPDLLYKIGTIYFDNNQLEEAIKYFKRVIQLVPEHKLALFNLGNAYTRLGNYEEAIKYWRQVISIDPNFTRAHFNLGLVYERLGRISEAISELQIALSLVRISGGPTSLEKRIKQELDRIQQLQMKRQSTSLVSQEVSTQLQLGLILLKQGKYQEAEKAFLELIELAPDYPEAYLNLGIVYFRLKRLDEAEKYLKKAIELQPDNPNAYFHLGSLYFEQGRNDEALEAFKKVLELDPSNSFAYYSIARIYSRLQKYYDAIPYYLKAIELNPLDSYAHNNLGLAYFAIGKLDEAIRYFLKALDLDPNDSFVYYNLAKLYYYTGKLALAKKYIENAINLQPNVEYLLLLGEIHHKKREYKEALQVLSKALEIAPNNPEVYFYISKIYSTINKFDLAIKYMEHAIKLAPKQEYFMELGTIYMTLKKYDDALEQFQKALKVGPRNHEVLRKIAIALIEKGNYEQARQYLQEVISLDPSSPFNYFLMIKLYYELGEYEAFLDEMLRALELDNSLAYYYLGMTLLKFRVYQGAVEALRKALRLDPYNDLYQYYYALALYKSKNLSQAKEILENLRGRFIDLKTGYMTLIDIYELLGEKEGALELTSEAIEALESADRLSDVKTFLEKRYELAFELGRYDELLSWGVREDLPYVNFFYLLAMIEVRPPEEVIDFIRSKHLDDDHGVKVVLAKALYLQGEVMEAWEILQSLPDNLPNKRAKFERDLLLVKILSDQRKFREALELLNSSNEIKEFLGRDLLFLNLKAMLLMEISDLEEAKGILEALEGDNITRILKAIYHVRFGRYGEALKYLEGISDESISEDLRKYPKFIKELYEGSIDLFKAKLLIKEKRLEEAEKILERYMNVKYEDYYAYYLLGTIKYLKKEYDDAIWMLRKALEINTYFSSARETLSDLYMDRDMYDFAIEELYEVVKINPYDYRAYLKLGKISFYQRAFSRAEAFLKKVLEYNASMWEAYHYLYLIQLFKGDKTALSKLEKLKDKFPNEPDLWESLGQLYIKFGEVAKAESLLKEALSRFPDNPKLYIALAGLYIHTKRYTEAFKVYDQGIKRTDDANIYAHRGVLLYRMNKYNEALADLQEALKRDSYNVLALTHMALIYTIGNKVDEAIEMYKKVLKAKPLNPTLYYNLGVAYEKKNMYVEAMENYEMALELNQRDPNLYKRLFDIYKRFQNKIKAEKLAKRALQDPVVPPQLKEYFQKSLEELKSK